MPERADVDREGTTRRSSTAVASISGYALAGLLVALLVLPLLALLLASSPASMQQGMEHRLFGPALWLSAKTTAVSLAIVVVSGTPLAWWLATARPGRTRVVAALVDLPIVIPPAVVGVALLEAFGRQGLLGPALQAVGITLPFSSAAVVVAQVVVSSPFYVQAAANAFRRVDPDLMAVARTLGAPPPAAFVRVALPVAMPGLVGGAALAWARSVGEFGATLLFAGNFPGTTQTMPLAIYTALESDVDAAVAIAVVLAGMALAVLVALRIGPVVWQAWRARGEQRP